MSTNEGMGSIIGNAIRAAHEIEAERLASKPDPEPPASPAEGVKPWGDAPTDGSKFDVWYSPRPAPLIPRPWHRVTDVYWSDIQEAFCIDGLYGPEEPLPIPVSPLPAFWQPVHAPDERMTSSPISAAEHAAVVAERDRLRDREGLCPYCNGDGDVHSIDGEWRGVCSCSSGQLLTVRSERAAATTRAEAAEAKVNRLECRYEDWRKVTDPPHEIQIDRDEMLCFYGIDEDDEGVWRTGPWTERPEWAVLWCPVVIPTLNERAAALIQPATTAGER